MRLYFYLFCFSFSLLPESRACSIFENPSHQRTEIAHNVDWYSVYNQTRGMLSLNPSGLKKSGELMGAPIAQASWTSNLKSVSFSTVGAEFPVSGFNEAGLTMGILMLAQANYPVDSDSRPALGAAQFVQYNLDLSSTIEDVEASASKVRPYSKIAKMHYFACDSSSECIVIQYINGEPKIYKGKDLPYKMLTNSLYPDSAQAASHCSIESICQNSDSSLQRFIDLSVLAPQVDPDQDFATQAFGILNQAAQVTGATTRFQIVYDASQKILKARTYGSTKGYDVRISFDQIKCDGTRKFIEILPTGSVFGAKDQWQILTESIQRDFVTKFGYPAAAVDAYGKFPFEVARCLE